MRDAAHSIGWADRAAFAAAALVAIVLFAVTVNYVLAATAFLGVDLALTALGRRWLARASS